MSADLFSAFGETSISHSSHREDQQIIESQVGSKASTWAKVPSNARITQVDEPLWKPSQGGNDVLFDATEEHDSVDNDEEFGDFQEVISSQPVAQTPSTKNNVPTVKSPHSTEALIDLLSLDDAPPEELTTFGQSPAQDLEDLSFMQRQIRSSPRTDAPDEDDGWGAFETVASPSLATTPSHMSESNTQQAQALVPVTTKSLLVPKEPQLDDEWDDFEDGSAALPKTSPSQAPLPSQHRTAPSAAFSRPDDDDWEPFDDSIQPSTRQIKPDAPPAASSSTSISPLAPRPTNIPPPSTLLSWLTQIYSLPTNNTRPEPNTILLLYTVTARIIAARTLRWRRDTLLSQSLRISDTTSGARTSGMKLSSLSKAESARESREASETLAAWNALVPRYQVVLREAGMKAPSGKGLRLQMPMAVKTLANAQGGMEAGYICPVCGLKRSERVVGVDDVGVEDVFGEHWRDGWGHEGCASAWYEWKGFLGQR